MRFAASTRRLKVFRARKESVFDSLVSSDFETTRTPTISLALNRLMDMPFVPSVRSLKLFVVIGFRILRESGLGWRQED